MTDTDADKPAPWYRGALDMPLHPRFIAAIDDLLADPGQHTETPEKEN